MVNRNLAYRSYKRISGVKLFEGIRWPKGSTQFWNNALTDARANRLRVREAEERRVREAEERRIREAEERRIREADLRLEREGIRNIVSGIFTRMTAERTITYNDNITREFVLNLFTEFYGTNDDIYVTLKIGDTYYTLNEENLNRIRQDIIDGVNIAEGMIAGVQESDVEMVELISRDNSIGVLSRSKEEDVQRERIAGKFFKYVVKEELHMEAWNRYGIFKLNEQGKLNKDQLKMNCLYIALKQHNLLTAKELASLSQSFKNRSIPLTLLSKLALKLDIYIHIRHYRHSKTFNYGNKDSDRIFNIGNIADHYFIIDNNTNICKYALKNYEEVKDIENWNHIYQRVSNKKKTRTNYAKNINKAMDSYKLINMLLEKKDTMLTKLNFSHGIDTTQFYDKFTEIGSLDYNPKLDAKLVIKQHKYQYAKEIKFLEKIGLCITDLEELMDCFPNEKVFTDFKDQYDLMNDNIDKLDEITQLVDVYTIPYKKLCKLTSNERFNKIDKARTYAVVHGLHEIVEDLLSNRQRWKRVLTTYDKKVNGLIEFNKVAVALDLSISQTNVLLDNKDTYKQFVYSNKREEKKKDLSLLPHEYFDFETITSEKIHESYLCCTTKGDKQKRSFFDKENVKRKNMPISSGLQFLQSIQHVECLLIAHNLGYDFRFIMKYLFSIKLIEKSNGIMSGTALFHNKKTKKTHKFYFKDSLKMIPMKLEKFAESFGIKDMKRLDMPYELYNKCLKLKGKHPNITEAVKELREDQKDIFIANINKWKLYKGASKFKIYQYFEKCCTLKKEVMPYKLYSKANLRKKKVTIVEALECLKTQDEKDRFLENIKEWELISKTDDTKFDHLTYSLRYCLRDCEVLKKGYETFKKWMFDITELNVDNFISLPSLIHQYLVNKGCYEGIYKLSGVPRMFIQKCLVGGRCMTRDNKKYHIKKMLQDFDAVSLYPSAMVRMEGFLKGLPKVIELNEQGKVKYNQIKNHDGYFVEIKVTKVNKTRHFPLLSWKNEDGIRNFSNELTELPNQGKINRLRKLLKKEVDSKKPVDIDETNKLINKYLNEDKVYKPTIYVDKIALQDLIKYQEIEFEIIRGYYFNDGRNETIKKVMADLFNERLKKKSEIMPDGSKGNPVQIIYKLLMNSAYGKTIMKPIETDNVFFDNLEKKDRYVTRNHNFVKHYKEICNIENKFLVKVIKPINCHYSIPHVGIEILSMSKRIMNEVICVAEDNNIMIYYQDTDSMHIDADKIDDLSRLFKAEQQKTKLEYPKESVNDELVGKMTGQFHIDFDFKTDKGTIPISIESFIITKKVYIDKVKTVNDGIDTFNYHIRMKGVSGGAVKAKGDVMETYEKLYNGEEVEFDLIYDDFKVIFEFNNDYTINSKLSFPRCQNFGHIEFGISK